MKTKTLFVGMLAFVLTGCANYDKAMYTPSLTYHAPVFKVGSCVYNDAKFYENSYVATDELVEYIHKNNSNHLNNNGYYSATVYFPDGFLKKQRLISKNTASTEAIEIKHKLPCDENELLSVSLYAIDQDSLIKSTNSNFIGADNNVQREIFKTSVGRLESVVVIHNHRVYVINPQLTFKHV